MNKLLGFTLAETLVVIGLIGIVSALTLPNLNSKTGDKEQVVRVQKQQQVLSEAYGRARAKYGTNLTAWLDLDSSDADRSQRVANRLKEFMNVKTNCGVSVNAGCFASTNVTSLAGNTFGSYDALTSVSKFVANDGTSYGVQCQRTATTSSGASFTQRSGCYIIVDVDGPNKGPNKIGKDLFRFTITSKSPQIFTSPLTLVFNVSDSCRTGAISYCTSYVLENGTTDYPTGTFNIRDFTEVCSRNLCLKQ